MILVHEVKFLVCIIIIGIALTMFDGGESYGNIDSKPDECKTNPTLPICEEFCYQVFLEHGGGVNGADRMMNNVHCRRWSAGAWWIVEVANANK